MNESDRLFAEYVRDGSDAAFGELVGRYIDLVYSTALRIVGGDTHRAQDIAQTVFLDLARKAHTLSADISLGGWLHRDTCLVAGHVLRSERRRIVRERRAVEMDVMQNDSEADLSSVAPLLDEAINELDEPDRKAIVLRFFEQHDFRRVGQVLGTNEDAARMRVSRALDKLELLLKRRGVTATSGALGILLSTSGIQAAPAALVGTIASVAAVAKTAVGVSAAKAVTMTVLQKTLITAGIAGVAAFAIYESRQAGALQTEAQRLKQQNAQLVEEVTGMRGENEHLSNRLVQARDSRVLSQAQSSELLRLRAQATRARDLAREMERMKAATPAANQSLEEESLIAEVREAARSTDRHQASLLKGALDLDVGQEISLHDLLSRTTDLYMRIFSAGKSGTISELEMRKQLGLLFADKEKGIVALLDPEQQTRYEQLKKDEHARRVKSVIEQESASIKRMFRLSEEQTAAVAAALGSVPYGPLKSDTEGVPPGASESKEEFQKIIAALQTVLLADQLETYRRTRLQQIEAIQQMGAQPFGEAAPQTPLPAGIGLEVGMQNGYPVIRHVLPGSPAESAGGLYEGDVIVAVAQGDSQFIPARGLTPEQVAENTRGKPGTTIQLQVLASDAPPGSTPRVISLVREQLSLNR